MLFQVKNGQCVCNGIGQKSIRTILKRKMAMLFLNKPLFSKGKILKTVF